MKTFAKELFQNGAPKQGVEKDCEQPILTANQKEKTLTKPAHLPALWFKGTDPQLDLIILFIIEKKIFYAPCNPMLLFYNHELAPIIEIKPKLIPYYALLLKDLHDCGLLETDSEKCYLQVAARLVQCNGKPLTAAKLSKANQNTKTNPVANCYAIDFVASIILALEKLHGGAFTRNSSVNKKIKNK